MAQVHVMIRNLSITSMFSSSSRTSHFYTLQIENEYNNVQLAYRELGTKYIKWAADLALELYKGVPWIMCKQKDAPQSIVSSIFFIFFFCSGQC